MPDTHNPKQRCEECKSVLVKGVVISVVGETRVECGKCRYVNILSVEPRRVVRAIERNIVIGEAELVAMEAEFEKQIEIAKHRFGGLQKTDEDNLRSIFSGKIGAYRMQLSRATGT